MADSVVMAEIWRGDIAESCHRGHAVVCDSAGRVRASWGDPDKVILPRSSCKMLQALPLLESGAAGNLSSEYVALACGSHEGGAMHVSRIGHWLDDMGCSKEDLLCGTQVPGDRAERHRLRATGDAPDCRHHTCSGKHAGFLMLNTHLGGARNYVDPDHMVQKTAQSTFEEMTGLPVTGIGTDGCSAPNFGTTVLGLATAMARVGDPSALGKVRQNAVSRLFEAMTAHPLLVAGHGRACSELMVAMEGRVAVKTGAEGVFAAILPEQGLGVAVKIEDGANRGSECAIAAILVRLGVLPPLDPAVLKRLMPPILSSVGADTGSVRPATGFWDDGRPLGN